MKSSFDFGRTITRKLKSSFKALMRAVILTGALLLPNVSAQPATVSPTNKRSIRDRVTLVRETLKDKVANEQSTGSKLSFAESSLAQWGNWGNWRNWGNWNNWNNWRNWSNWGNWGNV